MQFIYDDGGREASGYKGKTGDCVTRAVAIATGLPYHEVYDRLAEGNATQRITKRTSAKIAGKRTASHGISTERKWFKDYLKSMGWRWVPTMHIGSGCRVHLKADELPSGRIMVRLSRHYTVVIDGVIHDTYDCSRDETRCVYGYWYLNKKPLMRLEDNPGHQIKKDVEHLEHCGLYSASVIKRRMAIERLIKIRKDYGYI